LTLIKSFIFLYMYITPESADELMDMWHAHFGLENLVMPVSSSLQVFEAEEILRNQNCSLNCYVTRNTSWYMDNCLRVSDKYKSPNQMLEYLVNTPVYQPTPPELEIIVQVRGILQNAQVEMPLINWKQMDNRKKFVLEGEYYLSYDYLPEVWQIAEAICSLLGISIAMILERLIGVH